MKPFTLFPLVVMLQSVLLPPLQAAEAAWPEWPMPKESRLSIILFGSQVIEGRPIRFVRIQSPMSPQNLIEWYRKQWQALDPTFPSAEIQAWNSWLQAGQIVKGFYHHIQLENHEGKSSTGYLTLSPLKDFLSSANGPSPERFGLPPGSERTLWQEYEMDSQRTLILNFRVPVAPQRLRSQVIEVYQARNWKQLGGPSLSTGSSEVAMSFKQESKQRHLVIQAARDGPGSDLTLVEESR